MSKKKLNDVLTEVLAKLESYTESVDKVKTGGHNDNIRRLFSGIQTHTVEFSPATVKTAARVGMEDAGIIPTAEQQKEIDRLCTRHSNDLKALWKVSDYTYTQEAGITKSGKAKGERTKVFRSMFGEKYTKLTQAFNLELSQAVNSQKAIKFVDAGHETGFGIGETAIYGALVETGNFEEAQILKEKITNKQIKTILTKIPDPLLNSRTGDAFEFHVQVKMEGQRENRGTAAKLNWFGEVEQGSIVRLIKELRTLLDKKDWPNVEGSPSIIQEAITAISDAVNGKKHKKGTRSTVSKTTNIKSRHTTSKPTGIGRIKKAKPNPRNWLSMIGAINARLPEVVRGNMGEPGLVNRTGRFAGSTRVTTIQTTPQGFPSIGYTYDKTPYGVFDRRLGALPWATPERDPGLVIEKSIREIVASLAIGRFYLRRE